MEGFFTGASQILNLLGVLLRFVGVVVFGVALGWLTLTAFKREIPCSILEIRPRCPWWIDPWNRSGTFTLGNETTKG
jgi:hypothetical protein